jgi:Putative adhesin
MPKFSTPAPISVTLDVPVGVARIAASDRGDTVVEVRPADPSNEADVRAAEQTRVEHSDGRLLVKAPRPRGLRSFSRHGSVEIAVDVPAGSDVQGDGDAARFECDGRLGGCRLKTSAGDIRVGETGPLRAATSMGDVSVGSTVGHADVSTGSGRLRIGTIDGTAAVKNGNGETVVGAVAGDLRLRAANGDVAIERADASVVAKTANGSVRVGSVARGTVELQTAAGEIEVGIRAGTAAYLDVSTRFGRVHNSLEASDAPDRPDETVEVHARTAFGDIVIRRA